MVRASADADQRRPFGVNLWLFEHVGARSLGERWILAVAEGGPGRLLGAGAGDQPFGPGPPPRALLHAGCLEPLVGIRRRGRAVPAVIAIAVRRVDDRLDVTGADQGHLLVAAADQMGGVV